MLRFENKELNNKINKVRTEINKKKRERDQIDKTLETEEKRLLKLKKGGFDRSGLGMSQDF